MVGLHETLNEYTLIDSVECNDGQLLVLLQGPDRRYNVCCAYVNDGGVSGWKSNSSFDDEVSARNNFNARNDTGAK